MTCALAVTFALAAAVPRTGNAQSSGELPTPEEQQAAWNSLSDGDRQLAVDVFEDRVLEPIQAETVAEGPNFPSPEPLQLAQAQQPSARTEAAVAEHLDLASALAGTPVLGFGSVAEDGDGDAIPDPFENTVAQSFMPEYHVSAGEQSGVGFSRFVDQSSSLQAGPVLRQQPPIVHTRVTGLGGRWEGGVLLGYLRADYLTMWNRDTGYPTDPFCTVVTAGLLRIGHDNDVERSALLVAAPVVWGGDNRPRYNPDPSAYRGFYQFTTAHEDFPLTSENRLFRISPPSLPNDHASLALYLSKSKHGTYAFNPDGHEVLIEEFRLSVVVTTTFFEILVFVENILGGGQLNRALLIATAVLLIGTVVVEHCFTESFSEQGGIVPTDPLNVGEHRQLLPGFSFINHADVRAKLVGPPVKAPRGTRDCGHTWAATKFFQPGESFTGCRGLSVMQGDGNLVFYDGFDVPRWSTGTAGWPGAFAVFQGDGHFVVYSSSGQPLWVSGTAGIATGGLLSFQDDGNLVIYTAAVIPVWTRHSGRLPIPAPPPRATLTAVHSNRCLDVAGASLADGGTVQQFSCHGGTNQQWQVTSVAPDTYRLTAVHSGKCLDLAGGSLADGGTVQQWSCHGGTNQRWRMAQVELPEPPPPPRCPRPPLPCTL